MEKEYIYSEQNQKGVLYLIFKIGPLAFSMGFLGKWTEVRKTLGEPPAHLQRLQSSQANRIPQSCNKWGNLSKGIDNKTIIRYKQSPTHAKFTKAVPTLMQIEEFCVSSWVFRKILLTQILRNGFFAKILSKLFYFKLFFYNFKKIKNVLRTTQKLIRW